MLIFVSDLKDIIRKDVEEAIKKSDNKELKKALDEDDQIILADIGNTLILFNETLKVY